MENCEKRSEKTRKRMKQKQPNGKERKKHNLIIAKKNPKIRSKHQLHTQPSIRIKYNKKDNMHLEACQN